MNISFCTRFISAFLLFVLSAAAGAQDDSLPAFDGFSYLRGPLFGEQRRQVVAVAADCPASEPVQQVVQAPADPPACPESLASDALSQNERFELQLALDKALSQILKLTVDYEALRTRVENIRVADSQQSDGWFSLGGSSTTGEDKLQELLDLNSKRLEDRDQQIALLTRRLDALQTRYDNENVSRLLTEKRLKLSEDKSKETRQKMAIKDEKVRLLMKQLETDQQTIRQLKKDLTAERLKTARQTEQPTQPAQVAAPATAGHELDSPFELAREWVVRGLEFREGSAEIERASIASLASLVEHLQKNENLAIQINGYTDNIGTANSNLVLSQTRAEAVAEYLVELGIGAHRIKALGYGERRPVASNETEQGREQNRRVAVLILE